MAVDRVITVEINEEMGMEVKIEEEAEAITTSTIVLRVKCVER